MVFKCLCLCMLGCSYHVYVSVFVAVCMRMCMSNLTTFHSESLIFINCHNFVFCCRCLELGFHLPTTSVNDNHLRGSSVRLTVNCEYIFLNRQSQTHLLFS